MGTLKASNLWLAAADSRRSLRDSMSLAGPDVTGTARVPFWFVFLVGGFGVLHCTWLYQNWSTGIGHDGPFPRALVTSLSPVTYVRALALVV